MYQVNQPKWIFLFLIRHFDRRQRGYTYTANQTSNIIFVITFLNIVNDIYFFKFPVRRKPPRRRLHGRPSGDVRTSTGTPSPAAGALPAAGRTRTCVARRASCAQTRQRRYLRVSPGGKVLFCIL